MRTVNNVKPQSLAIANIKPRSQAVDNVRPSTLSILDTNFAYTETRTINQGQPYMWGLNWALTYSSTFSFTGVRL